MLSETLSLPTVLVHDSLLGFVLTFFTALQPRPREVTHNPNSNTINIQLGSQPTYQPQTMHLPLLTFGVIADVQYAPIPDGASYSGTPRYYTAALPSLVAALSNFNTRRCDFVLNLGDSIDGQCPPADVPKVATALRDHRLPVHSVYGNHELYVLSRKEIAAQFGIPMIEEAVSPDASDEPDLVGYYTKSLPNDYKFVFVDTYDECVMGRTGAKLSAATALLSQNNPNFASGEINSPIGLDGVQRRFVAFNGGVGARQMRWLEDELIDARTTNKRVVVSAHQPFHPSTGNVMCLPFNYEELLSLFEEYKDVVVATLSGHTHSGGYHVEPKTGIHHVVFDAILESPPGTDTHSIVTIFEDEIVLEGFGRQTSRVMKLKKKS